jgi:hypothetical protein
MDPEVPTKRHVFTLGISENTDMNPLTVSNPSS